jgi:hypothetical protein
VGTWRQWSEIRAPLRRGKKQRPGAADEQGFDLPPGRDEFDMKDLMGSVKKHKMVNPLAKESASKSSKDQQLFAVERIMVNGNVATIPKTDRDKMKAARVLNIRAQVKKENEKKKAKNHSWMEGESKSAYAKRTKAETRQIIKQTTEVKNPEKKQRKNEFMQNKKKNKKRGASSFYNSEDEVDDHRDGGESDTLITGEHAIALVDEVHFGEQAERPPTFCQLPRGAKEKEGTAKKVKKTAKQSAKGMTDEAVDGYDEATNPGSVCSYQVEKKTRRRLSLVRETFEIVCGQSCDDEYPLI